MKRITSIIASALLFALLISTFAINVFAGVTQHEFSVSVYTDSYTHIFPARSKHDYSDMMIYIRTGNNSRYYIRTVACNVAGTPNYPASSLVNCTYYNSRIIDHCTVMKDCMYSVPNQVRYVHQYATFGFFSPGNPGTVTGYWSEDTTSQQQQQYATPIY